MFIIINSDCAVCGECAKIAPSIFRMNEQIEIAEVLHNPENDEEINQVKEAAEACPAKAILLHE
jgi:ferredoxin